MIDLHVHTHYSCDSDTSLSEYCEQAIKKDMKYICFTDHVDYNKADFGYMYYNAESYFDEFKRVKYEFGDKVNILSGIEFAEPHLYKKEFEKLSKLPYDFILGSIHFWIDDLFPTDMIKHNIPIETAFEKYWEEIYKCVKYGGFDSLAHIDFPKRYYKNCLWDASQITAIFNEMIKNNIALEINTSSLRKGLDEAMPGSEMLDIYEKAGGKKITFGADTHSIHDLAFGYDLFEAMIAKRFDNIVYINRKANKL